MSLFDDAPVERPAAHRIGEELDKLSIEELTERVGLLETEIARIRNAITTKAASRAAAAAFFKS